MRIDEEVKDRFEAICRSLGLSMASALMMYICEVNREERIPLSLSLKKDGRADVIDALRRMSASAPAELTSDEIDEEIRACRERNEGNNIALLPMPRPNGTPTQHCMRFPADRRNHLRAGISPLHSNSR